MARNRPLAMAFALGALAVPFLSSGLAGAAVTSPAADNVWYTGETKSISWDALSGEGTATLRLFDGDTQVDADPSTAGTQDITTTRFTAASSTSHSWRIPTGLSGADLTIKIVGAGTTPWAGTEVVSSEFDIVASSVAAVTPTGTSADLTITSKVTIGWTETGATGATVTIDLLRNDGATRGATTTSVVKNLAKSGRCPDGECEYEWTIPSGTAVDTDDATYKFRVTPASGASATSAAAFKIVDRTFAFAEWSSNLTPRAGEPVEIAWSSTGDLGTLQIEAIPAGDAAKAIVLAPKYPSAEGRFVWRPTFAQAGKTYTVRLTSSVKNARGIVFADTSTATVAVANPGTFSLAAPEGPTDGSAVLGQPITLRWSFGEDEGAPLAALLIDIALVDSANKTTKVASAIFGGFDEEGVATRTFTFRPSGKLQAGDYTVKATVIGSNDATYTKSSAAISLTAPANLSMQNPEVADQIERGQSVDVEWTITQDSELPVNINLLNATTNNATSLAKNVVGAEGGGKGKKTVTIPAKGITAGTNYKIQVISADLEALNAEVAVEITTPALEVTAPKGTGEAKDALTRGLPSNITWTLGSKSNTPVLVEIVKAADRTNRSAKAVLVVSAAAATASGVGSISFNPTTNIPEGDYVVRLKATDLGTAAVISDQFSINSAAIDTVTVASGGKVGDTVNVTWTLDPEATDTAKIELFEGSTLVAKYGTLAKTATATEGSGTFSWKIPAALPSGSTHIYTIKVTSLSDATQSASSSSFTVAAAS